MFTPEEFEKILARQEAETLDFKSVLYDLRNKDSALAFVKDVICMTNTPREGAAHIVIGVKKYSDGKYDLIGLQEHVDEADLQAQFADRVYPWPTFTYGVLQYQGKQFGLVTIPPVRVGPCVPVRELGDVLRQWQIYFRRGSRNSPATPEDIAIILQWFGKQVAPRAAYEEGGPAWHQFTNLVQGFDRSFHYILVLSPGIDTHCQHIEALGRAPWAALFDFDPKSDQTGTLAACRKSLESLRSLHVATLREHPTLNLNTGTYWNFVRGIEGRPETLRSGSWLEWYRADGAALNDVVRRLAARSSPTPVICVVLWTDQQLSRHLRSALEGIVGAFGDALELIMVVSNRHDYEPLAAEVGATLLEIPADQFCAGLRSATLMRNVGRNFPSSTCSRSSAMPSLSLSSAGGKSQAVLRVRGACNPEAQTCSHAEMVSGVRTSNSPSGTGAVGAGG